MILIVSPIGRLPALAIIEQTVQLWAVIKKLAIGIGLVLAITGGLWWTGAPSRSVNEAGTAKSATRKDRPNVALLERLAQEACFCEVDGGQNCDAAYDEAIAGYQVQSVATACAPVSSSFDQINFEETEYSVATGYTVSGNLPPGVSPRLCRQADAQAVEAAFNEVYLSDAAQSERDNLAAAEARNKAADRAILQVLKAIRSGEKMPPVSNSGGCA